MVLQGTIPNQKGMPVVQEWVAVRFMGSGLKVEAVEPFEAVAERLQLGRKAYANPDAGMPLSLKQQRQVAVDHARKFLLEKQEAWSERMKPELEAQRTRLKHLRSRQEHQLQLDFENDKRNQLVKEKDRVSKEKAIERRFDDHERFVQDVMTIEPAPYLKLVAVLHREA